LAFALAVLVPLRWGVAANVGKEPMVVYVVAAGLVVMPFALYAPWRSLAVPAAFGIGYLAAQCLWAALRYPTRQAAGASSVTDNIFVGALFGVGMGVALSAIALIILSLAYLLSSDRTGISVRLVARLMGGYLVGGLLAGLVVGALLRLTAWPLGTILVGILGGIIAYGALAPVVSWSYLAEGKGPMSLAEQAGTAVACGLFVGPVAGLMMRYGGFAEAAT
jgi:hypothetical protein